MSIFESYDDENVSSWVLVYFVESDPGKEFEILARTRLSVPEHVPLSPQLKVKVFYGKAKIEAYVVIESDDFYYLQSNLKRLTTEFTDCMLRQNIANRNKAFKQEWNDSFTYSETRKEDGVIDDGSSKKDNYAALQERYNALKNKFDHLHSMQCVMRSTMKVLMERVELLTEGKDVPKEEPLQIEEDVKPRTARNQIYELPVEEEIENSTNMVLIGTHKTAVPKTVFNSISWNSYSSATRKLLVGVFSKEVLATHTLTGKPSPAFLNAGKETKQRLDPFKTADIVETVTRRCNVNPTVVRSAITTKCADENKMYKRRKLRGEKN